MNVQEALFRLYAGLLLLALGYANGVARPNQTLTLLAEWILHVTVWVAILLLALIAGMLLWNRCFKLVTTIMWRGYSPNGEWPPERRMKISAIANYLGEFKFIRYRGQNREKITELMENAEKNAGRDHSTEE